MFIVYQGTKSLIYREKEREKEKKRSVPRGTAVCPAACVKGNCGWNSYDTWTITITYLICKL